MCKEPKETLHVDNCECVYCGHMFDGGKASNYDMTEDRIDCPKCKRKMKVFISCEYLCREILDEEGD